MSTQKRYIVKKAMHLGHIRTGIAVGDEILHDEKHNTMIIGGKVFDNTKDLDILKKYGWVALTSDKEAVEEVAKAKAKVDEENQKRLEESEKAKRDHERNLPVIKSDEDLMEDIDISHTRKAKKEPLPKKTHMEIIKGDQEPEEIIARAETEIKPMPVVRDDSLGGSSGPSRNAGAVKSLTAEQHAKLRADAEAKAKKGFVDPRIAQAKEAVDSVVPAPVKRGRGRPPKHAKKGTVEGIVSGTGPKPPSLDA
jgi:hypothetical protein